MKKRLRQYKPASKHRSIAGAESGKIMRREEAIQKNGEERGNPVVHTKYGPIRYYHMVAGSNIEIERERMIRNGAVMPEEWQQGDGIEYWYDPDRDQLILLGTAYDRLSPIEKAKDIEDIPIEDLLDSI